MYYYNAYMYYYGLRGLLPANPQPATVHRLTLPSPCGKSYPQIDWLL